MARMNRHTLEQLEQALRGEGCRITRQRKAILAFLSGCRDDHPSARDVHEALKRREPGLSLATVYNTLGILVRKGLIKLIHFEGRNNRYDTNVDPHVNLVCTGCGRIRDLAVEPPVASETVRARTGFEVRDCRLDFYGICAACRPGRSGRAHADNDW